ncbi:hypothetical protein CK203_045840 [Vitis vinifera]|uniref:Uncharacterized protein n=1 Tax=Vitis vinifera TaxID=29760 RepID=A0A438FM35_VITVI|nr:hypothetical protein CK203_045840 [Vitis vinifera]
MNKEGLEGPFLEEGVTKAMSELGGEKAPGPDEFLLAFSKFCWSIVGGEVLANKLKRVIDKVVFQTTSEDDFSGDEWLGFTFLGVMEVGEGPECKGVGVVLAINDSSC